MQVSTNHLTFSVPHTGVQAQKLVIQNPSKTPLVYKVKTTKPRLFSVHPNASTVAPGSSVEVTVSRNGEYTQSDDGSTKDKFLILGANVSEEESHQSSTDLWKKLEASKDLHESFRIKVVYEEAGSSSHSQGHSHQSHGHSGAGVAGAAGVGAAGAAGASGAHSHSQNTASGPQSADKYATHSATSSSGIEHGSHSGSSGVSHPSGSGVVNRTSNDSSDDADYTAAGTIEDIQGMPGVPHKSNLVDLGTAKKGPVLGPKPDYDPTPHAKADGPGKESNTGQATYDSYAGNSKEAVPSDSSYAGAVGGAASAVGGVGAAIGSFFGSKDKDSKSTTSATSATSHPGSNTGSHTGAKAESNFPGATGPSIHDVGNKTAAGFDPSQGAATAQGATAAAGTHTGAKSDYAGTHTGGKSDYAGTHTGGKSELSHTGGKTSGLDHAKLSQQVEQGGKYGQEQIGKTGVNVGGLDSKEIGAGVAGAGAAGAAGIGYYDQHNKKSAGTEGSSHTGGKTTATTGGSSHGAGSHTGSSSQDNYSHTGGKTSATKSSVPSDNLAHTGGKSEAAPSGGFDHAKLSQQVEQGGKYGQEQIGKTGVNVGGLDSKEIGAGVAGAGAAGAAGIGYYGEHNKKAAGSDGLSHTGGKTTDASSGLGSTATGVDSASYSSYNEKHAANGAAGSESAGLNKPSTGSAAATATTTTGGVQTAHHAHDAEQQPGVPLPTVFIIALVAFLFGWKLF